MYASSWYAVGHVRAGQYLLAGFGEMNHPAHIVTASLLMPILIQYF